MGVLRPPAAFVQSATDQCPTYGCRDGSAEPRWAAASARIGHGSTSSRCQHSHGPGPPQRIVDAQREIRVLQAIRWDNDVEEQFKKSRYRELPKVDAEYYERNPLGFDPNAKAAVFEGIARDVDRELGEADAIGAILGRTALEYRVVVRMLAARSSPVFYAYSR